MSLGFHKISIPIVSVGFSVLALCLGGCGTSTYEEKFSKTLDYLERETPFKDLEKQPVELPKDTETRQAVTAVQQKIVAARQEGGGGEVTELENQIQQIMADGQLTVRLPKVFAVPDSTYALDEDTPDPRLPNLPLDGNRIQPAFLKLPGHIRTYERFVDVTNRQGEIRQRPLYCYVATVNKKDKTATDLKEELTAQLVQAFGKVSAEELEKPRQPGTDPPRGVREWQVHTAPTPEGGTMEWQKLVAVGDMDFEFYEKTTEHDTTTEKVKKTYMSGKYVLYLHSSEKEEEPYHVLVGWRTRHDVDAMVGTEALADMAVGTIKFATSTDEDTSAE